MNKFAKIVSIFILILFITPLSAQTGAPETDTLFEQAQQKIAHDEIESARELLAELLELDKAHLGARLALGTLAIAEDDWRQANDHFEKLLEHHPENFDGHYYRAICFREIGKFRPEFLRKVPLVGGLLEFKKAERHFEWVVQRDSLFRDVLFQLATLRRYQENFTAALELAHRQLALKPDEAVAQVGLFNIYRQLIIRKNEKKAIAELAQLPRPHARFFAAEKWRREQKYALADSVFHLLLSEKPPMPLQPVYLALAKSASARGDDTAAETYFWQAVETITRIAEADLVFEVIKYIVDRNELAHYRALAAPPAKIAFFKKFWVQRDPLPAAERNVRLAEHLRRLNFCEQNYEFIGFRSWANSPDKLNYLRFPDAYRLNEEFNDKGLIYMRHGEPDDRIVTVGTGGFSQASLPPSNESWKYWPTENTPELTFHFIYDQFASGNLWRLTPILSHPALLADRVQWNPRYYRIQNAFSAGERFALEQEMAQASIASVDTGFVTDRHTWDKKVKPLHMPFTTATFRGKGGRTTVEVFWGMPLMPVAKALPKSADTTVIECGFAVHDGEWREVHSELRSANIPLDRNKLSDDRLFTEFFKTGLSPGAYFLALHVQPQRTNLLGGHAQIALDIPDYSGSELLLSDIVFAREIRTAAEMGRFVKNDLLVVPNPTRHYRSKRPVHIYFEVYNLASDAGGASRFTIEYIIEKAGGKKKFLGLFGGGKSSISVKTNRQSQGEFSAEFLAIDVRKIGKGEIKLTVRVTDESTGATAARTNSFFVY